MSAVKSVKGLVAKYNAAPQRVRSYFSHLPGLAKDYPLEVCLAYVFSKVETAHHMALYCGIVKLHRGESNLSWTAVGSHHMTRGEFRSMFETVFGKPLKPAIAKKLQAAEEVRDRVLHGKSSSEADKRTAIASLLEYAVEFNDELQAMAGMRPFGDMRGFKGAAKALDKKTTRWILKGMGFTVS